MVAIIIPVHNALAVFKNCIFSVLKTIRSHDRVFIIDNGSNTETRDVCTEIARDYDAKLQYIRIDEAIGFTRSANIGMKLANNDNVVLLNSDTVVVEGWLSGLENTAAVSKKIGIVGPLSNAASFQSIPELLDAETGRFKVNAIRSDIESLRSIQNACKTLCSDYPTQIVDIVNGFCLYISSCVISEIGFLDEVAFPRGYGEENDYCLRAGDAGFFCAISTEAFVFHEKTQSYSSAEREMLSKLGNETLIERYGARRIKDAVESMRLNPVMVETRKCIGNWFSTEGKSFVLVK